MRLEESFEPRDARLLVGRRAGDNGHQLRNHVVDGRADGARRAVDVFQGGRDTFEKLDRALGPEQRIDARDQRDLGEGLL